MLRAKSKPRIFKLLLMGALIAAVSAGNTAMAERLRIIPVPPHVVPQWTPMPDVPQVYFAPNLPTDVFRHRGRYFLYWEGVWYRSNKIKGPWSRLEPPPAIFSQINPAYFKTLPKGDAQPPAAAAPGQPPPGGEVLLTPDGRPAVPPTAPVPPAPPSGAYAPPPQAPAAPQPVTPPQPPEMTTPPQPAPPAQPPESQESAPLAVPEGPMPKAM